MGDKYPRMIAAALSFLQYHSLRGNGGSQKTTKAKAEFEIAFTQDRKRDPQNLDPRKILVSKTRREFEASTCSFKVKHTYKESPSRWKGINKGQLCDADGALIMCTIGNMDTAINLLPDNANILTNNR